ncbi:MAG: type III-B CRISPR module RAMP protein Cmr1 [Syntrophothermus sp.]
MSQTTTVCYKVKALTPIWTGDANQRGGRFITTGLLGSIRWWFEVLVRGLGGAACDPSDAPGRCPDRQGKRCVVCELFGCTGWARKFRFEAVDDDGQPLYDAIRRDQEFILRFVPLRPVRDEEWALLDVTLRLIANYGAIGGKTVLKPSDEQNRANQLHHRDYGLIEILEASCNVRLSKEKLRAYVRTGWREANHDGFAWASLTNFWCVRGRYLARQNADTSSFNRIIARPEQKRQASASQCDSWIAGRRPDPRTQTQPESKKVFSFKDPPRTFGFVQNVRDFERLVDQLKKQLATEWPGFQGDEIEKGDQILKLLFSKGGSS